MQVPTGDSLRRPICCLHLFSKRFQLTLATYNSSARFPYNCAVVVLKRRRSLSRFLTHNTNKNDTKRCVLPLGPSLSAPLAPPPPSPCSAPPRPPPPPEAAAPPAHDRASQRDAAACIPPAARSSAQAGTPSLRTSACAPSRTRDPPCTTPPQESSRV